MRYEEALMASRTGNDVCRKRNRGNVGRRDVRLRPRACPKGERSECRRVPPLRSIGKSSGGVGARSQRGGRVGADQPGRQSNVSVVAGRPTRRQAYGSVRTSVVVGAVK